MNNTNKIQDIILNKISVNEIFNENKININTLGHLQNSIDILSLKGGISIQSNLDFNIFSNHKLNLKASNIILNSNSLLNIKNKETIIETNQLLVKSNSNLNFLSNYGKINFETTNIDNVSILLNSKKGGIKLNSFKKMSISSNESVNISSFGENSQINIGIDSNKSNKINIGNNNSTVYLNNDIIINGKLSILNNQIEKITTTIFENNESLILLSKDNKYNSKYSGLIGKNNHNFIGFIFDNLKNEFFIADKLDFSLESGIGDNHGLSKLTLKEININNSSYIYKNGLIKCIQLELDNIILSQKGDISIKENGNLNIENCLEINSKNKIFNFKGNEFIINDVNINNFIKTIISKNYFYKTIFSFIEYYENTNEKTFTNEINLLSNETYNENIISNKYIFNINGNYGIVNGYIYLNNENNKQENISKINNNIQNYFYRNLTLNIDKINEYVFLMINIYFCNLFINNLNLFIYKNINNVFTFSFINKGNIYIDNLYIDNNNEINNLVNNIFFFKNVNKIIIKNSYLVSKYLFNIESQFSKLIIINCYLDVKINYSIEDKNKIFIYNNIINKEKNNIVHFKDKNSFF